MTDRLIPVSMRHIKITDELFGGYVRLVSERVIPYQWNILNDNVLGAEPTYCIRNFRIAAGEIAGERKGVVFEDSDLYKWIEAASYAVENGSGDKFTANINAAIDLITRAQEDDGYLNTYFSVCQKGKRFTNLLEGHELYCAGHLIEAAVAHHKATGKTTLLDVAVRFADLISKTFGNGAGQINGYPGHQEIELALVKLFRETGETRYLKTARYFIEQRGKRPNYFEQEIQKRNGKPEFFQEFSDLDMEYLQSGEPPCEQKNATGHAVRAGYMYSAMADLALEYDDREMFAACRSLWESITKRQMYITGSIGSSGFLERFTTDYDLPNTTNYSETCASIGLMMFGQRMSNATKKASYYDTVERALYNTVLAGISQSGDRYFYVNPLEVIPEFCTEHTYMSHVKPVRQKWFSVACCPPNVARTLASLGQYIYAQDNEGIYIQQFISSEMTVGDKGRQLKICMESSIMQNGMVRLEIDSDTARESIRIRIPGYAGNAKIKLNGAPISLTANNGYFLFNPEKGNNSLLIDFQVKPKWIAANSNVRADVGKVALKYGPCIYCLEETDNNNHLNDIYVDPQSKPEVTEKVEDLFGNLPAIKYKGYRLNNRTDDKKELYMVPDFSKEETEIKAVPYCLWGNRKGGEMLVWQKALI